MAQWRWSCQVEREIKQWKQTQTPALQALIPAVGTRRSPPTIPPHWIYKVQWSQLHLGSVNAPINVMGGAQNPPEFPEDVNYVNFISIQNFPYFSPENSKVTPPPPKKCQEVWLLQQKQKTNNPWSSVYLKLQPCYTRVSGLCWSPFQ